MGQGDHHVRLRICLCYDLSLWLPPPLAISLHSHLLIMATSTLTYSLWPPHPHLLTGHLTLTYSLATSPSPTHYGHLTYSLWPPLHLLITVNHNKHQIKDQLFMQTCRAPLKLTLYIQLVHTPCYAYSMDHLISFSPSSQLTKAQSELIWKFREHCSTIPEALPKFLQCVDWASLEQVQEAHRLLKIWRPITMEVCLRWPLRAREVTTHLILGGPRAVGLPLC